MVSALLFVIGLSSIVAFTSTIDSSIITETQYTTNKLQFLFTNKSEIWRLEPNGDKYQYLTNTTAIADVDYHLGKNILIWIDAERHEIHSQSLDINSTAPHLIFKQLNEWQPLALAVDFIGQKIYVADVLGVKIDVFELDGQYHGIAIGTDLVQPLDVKLDPYEGFLFILDGFRIVRASMDGNSPASVIKQGIKVLHGLSVNVIDKKIYWSRDKDLQIMFSNYAGTEIATLGKNSSSSYLIWTKFTVFNTSIFWAGNVVEYKSTCHDEEKSRDRKPLYQNIPVPTIKVLHASLQLPVPNPCGIDNGGCQHMCILTSTSKYECKTSNIGYKCACNAGWTLSVNSKNCTLAKDFLMYARSNIIKSHLSVSCTSGFCEPYLPVSGDRSVLRDFDYQYADNYLYYIQVMPLKYDTIYKVLPNNSRPEIVLLGKYENYQSLTIHHLTANLYFTDSSKGTINSVSTRNSSQKAVILENLERPEDIVIHPNHGFILFFQTNESTKITVLSKANIDGTNLTIFYNVPLKKHCGFTIDFNEDTIYWYEWRKKYIQSSNLNMDEIRTLQTPLTQYLYTISLYDKWIYVAGTTSEGVWRFDKKTGKQPELILSDFTNRILKIKVFSLNFHNVKSNQLCSTNNDACSVNSSDINCKNNKCNW